MPPGSKKRKAAKKKKEQQASHNQTNTNNPLGNDDLKSQDERESNGCEAGSPASLDHHNDHPFKEGNGEFKKWDPTPVRTFHSEIKSMDEVARGLEGVQKGVEDDGAVTVERELKSEENSGSQSISIKDVEFVQESHDRSSSSSCSDNESQVVEKRMMKVESQNEENKQVDSFQKDVIQGTESENASLGQTDNSIVETAPIGHSVKLLVTESKEVIHVTQGDSFEISVVSDAVESLNENEVSNRNEEKVIPLTGENVGASSTMVETMENENVGKILPTSVTPTAETSNGGESIRDSKIPDPFENQPLVASAPRVEQRTSWMSCCGLFDVLTGSSR